MNGSARKCYVYHTAGALLKETASDPAVASPNAEQHGCKELYMVVAKSELIGWLASVFIESNWLKVPRTTKRHDRVRPKGARGH